MPTIKIPITLATVIASTSGLRTATTSVGGMGSTNATSGARIRIMSGPIPTQQELEIAYPTWGRFTGSPSEILIQHDVESGTLSQTNDILEWGLKTENAINSGVASWWIWTGHQQFDPADRDAAPGAPNNYYLAAICGDISVVGGSGSMTLADTNIVAGQPYEIGPAQFPIPLTYTYA